MLSGSLHSLRLALACLLAMIVILLVPRSSAQAKVNPMEEAAGGIADSISQAKLKTVVVFDFSGPNNKLTQLGLVLTASFRTVLAKSGPKFQVEDAQEVNKALAKHSYAPEIVLFPESLLAAAQDLSASGFVAGKFSVVGDTITLDISAYRSKDGKALRSERVTWPLSEDLRALSVKNTQDTAKDGESSPTPRSGVEGYTYPKCVYCPRADYSREAMQHHYEGIVELMAVVERDGSIGDVLIVKPLPYGLSAQAINAVRKWKLSPALAPDGKPVRVRQVIEVSFQLYGR
jgi:TonB family protein